MYMPILSTFAWPLRNRVPVDFFQVFSDSFDLSPAESTRLADDKFDHQIFAHSVDRGQRVLKPFALITLYIYLAGITNMNMNTNTLKNTFPQFLPLEAILGEWASLADQASQNLDLGFQADAFILQLLIAPLDAGEFSFELFDNLVGGGPGLGIGCGL